MIENYRCFGMALFHPGWAPSDKDWRPFKTTNSNCVCQSVIRERPRPGLGRGRSREIFELRRSRQTRYQLCRCWRRRPKIARPSRPLAARIIVDGSGTVDMSPPVEKSGFSTTLHPLPGPSHEPVAPT